MSGERQSALGKPRGYRTLVISAFVILAVMFVLMKSNLLDVAQAGRAGGIHFSSGFQVCDNELRPCFRAASLAILLTIEWVLRVAVSPFLWDLSRSVIEAATPWPLDDMGAYIEGRVIPFATSFLFSLLCIVPIYYGATTLFRRPAAQLVFLVAAFGALFGWHPLVVTVFFDAASLFVDFPRAYYLFQARIHAYDFMALAIVMGTLLYTANRGRKRLWEIAVLAAIGQLTLEHMGFVVGVSIAVAALFEVGMSTRERVRTAARRLAVAGVACVLVMVPAVWAFNEMGFTADYGADKPWLKNNLLWWNSSLANVFTMCVLAAFGGVVAGIVGGLGMTASDAGRARIILGGGIGVMIAYAFVFVAGLYFLTYPAEMGRQFMPLSLAVAVMTTSGTAWLIYKYRSAHGWNSR